MLLILTDSYRKFSSIDVSGNYLRFIRIAPADEGRYVCTATNRYGNTTKVAEVIVNRTKNVDVLSPFN